MKGLQCGPTYQGIGSKKTKPSHEDISGTVVMDKSSMKRVSELNK
jgi:hypothetical protein